MTTNPPKITLNWSVPIKIWGKEIVSLTWSATVIEIWWKKYLVDLGMFQWWEWSELFNKENIEFLENIDWVIITHSHIDHIWRLPLLYKMGFKWQIYMTPETKSITNLMLLDSYKIKEWDKVETLRRNNKLWSRLSECIKIRDQILLLEKNTFLNEWDKDSVKLFLNRKLWNNYDKEDNMSQIQDYLDFYKVNDQLDIEKVLTNLKENLYEIEDIEWVMSLITTIDYWDKKILSSKSIDSKNNNSDNQDLLNNLPEKTIDWFDDIVYIEWRSQKRILKKKWESKLSSEILRVKNSWIIFNKERDEFKKILESAFSFCEKYSFLDESESKDNNMVLNINDSKPYRKKIKHYKKFLNLHWVKVREDIERVIDDTEKLIDLFKIDIPYNSEDIKTALNLLEITNIRWNEREIISMEYSDAAHIIGSASVTLTSGIVKWQINDVLLVNWDWFTVHLSWDLWRIEYNRLWKPDLPPSPVDYLQIESTYWWRDHLERDESVESLTNSIEESKWNVLISVFSQQRLQEVLMTLLEEKIKKWVRFLDYDILIDAPLWEKITNIYLSHQWKKYDLLDPKKQIQIFWKLVFRFLWEWEWEEVYKEKDFTDEENNKKIPKKKNIILASSWMMDGWAIMNHLPEILKDSDATILAPGYLSENTIWNQIVISWKDSVTINWEKIKVECNKKFIDWFSSHIWHNEIIDYIVQALKSWKLKREATIALNHWWMDWKLLIKKDIEENLKYFWREDIEVTIPDIFDTYDLWEKEVVSNPHIDKDNSKISKVLKSWKKLKKPKIPNCLSNEFKIDEKNEFKIDEKVHNLKESNNIKIEKAKGIIKNLDTIIELYVNDYFHLHLKSKKIPILDNINNLSRDQLNTLNNEIRKKLKSNRSWKNSISTLNDKISDLSIFTNNINNFKSTKTIFNESNEGLLEANNEVWLINEFTRELKKYSPKQFHQNIENIIEIFVKNYSADVESELKLLLDRILDSLNENIIDEESNLKKDLIIEFKQKTLNYDGKDIYSDLYWINANEIDSIINKLESYISEWLFSNEELEIISQHLNIMKSDSNDSTKKEKSNKYLKKYFKSKQRDNIKPWINFNLNFKELYDSCLTSLSLLFEWEYFNNVIKNSFNVYIFLKSWSTFEEYIKSKYDIKRLKWNDFEWMMNIYNSAETDLEFLSKVVEQINQNNKINLDLNNLSDLEFWINSTIDEITTILNTIKLY